MTSVRDPEHYELNLARPADFDGFWAEVLAQAGEIPLEPVMEPVPLRSTDDVEVFEIRYRSLDGVVVAGWYCRPSESVSAPPYPGLMLVPGYVSEPTLPTSWARRGYAAIGVAPRGKLRSNIRYNPGYPGLLVHNIVDRNTYAYRGFYVDAVRALDFLRGRPEVDAARIGIHGSSQGGALTIITCALRPGDIACGAAGAPYLCGMMAAASLTHSYPYEEINEYLRVHPSHRSMVEETLAYFDGVNFAPLIQAPMLVYIGLEDHVCPPETGYAVFRAMSCEKELVATPRCAHDAGAYWVNARVERFLAEHLRPVAALSVEAIQ
ncbi:MAG TPA: acetylxylan esterase [Candidatus Dormibacteraeota bacterium]|jgi:cephalosporin-C deacetylase|nr:acetylxylan esterase [Candidatus Dormibacteraeota bacterium]